MTILPDALEHTNVVSHYLLVLFSHPFHCDFKLLNNPYRQVSVTPMGLFGSHDAPTPKGASFSSRPLAAGAVGVVAAGVACDVVMVRQTRKRIFVRLFS
jgi:hypothetical protein